MNETLDTNQPPIAMGCDHAAYQLKEIIKKHLTEMGIHVEDVGTHDEKSVDYPDFGKAVASLVSTGKYKRGILICGTGLGMSMVANRYPHVRAALCAEPFSAEMSRRHNNSNILVMGARVIGDVMAKEIVNVWLNAPFDGDRHQKRINKFESRPE